jgi:outer membrane protein assembly factor BamB
MYVSAIAIVVLLALMFFMFKSCGDKPAFDPKDPIRPFVTFSILDKSLGPQPFMMIGLTLPSASDEKFKVAVTGLPEGMKPIERKLPFSPLTYDSYMTIDPKGFDGTYNYSVEVTFKELKKNFKGSFVVGERLTSPDTYFGGQEKNGIIDSKELKKINLANSFYAGENLVSNICALGENAIIGNTNGELKCASYLGKELWSVKIFDEAVSTLQCAGDTIIASNPLGIVASYNVNDLKFGKSDKQGAYDAGVGVSYPPTIISNKFMVCGFKDGAVRAFSLPELNLLWTKKTYGPIAGHIPIWAVKTKDGNEKAFLYAASEDKNLYMFDLDGEAYLQNRFSELLKSGASMLGNRMLVSNAGNYSRYMDFMFDVFMEVNIEDKNAFQPLLFADKAVFFGDNKIIVKNTQDYFSDEWSLELKEKISVQPFIIGSKLFIPHASGNLRIFNTTTGDEFDPLFIGANLTGAPIKIGEQRFAFATVNGTVYFMGETTNTPNGNFPDNTQETIIQNGSLVNLNHNIAINVQLPNKLNKKWELDGNFASPITTNKRIYVYSISGKYFACYDIKTGKQVWKVLMEAADYNYKIKPSGLFNTPMWLTPKGLYISTKVGLKLLNATNGETLASTPIKGIPQADDKTVVITNENAIYCLENNLNVRWKKDGTFTPPNVIINQDTIIAADTGEKTSNLYFLDKSTGKIVWTNPDKNDKSAAFFSKIINSKNGLFALSNMGLWYMSKKDKKVYGTSQNSSIVRDFFYLESTNEALIIDRMGLFGSFNLQTGMVTPIIDVKKLKDPPDLMRVGMTLIADKKAVSFGTLPPMPPKTPRKQGEQPPKPPDTVVFKLFIKNFTDINSLVKTDLPPITRNFYGLCLGEKLIIAYRAETDNSKLIVYGE